MALLLIAALTMASNLYSVAAPPPQQSAPFETMSLPPEALSWDAAPTADRPAQRNPKLDSTLADLAAAAEDSAQTALAWAQAQSLRLSGDRVHVQIVTHAAGLQGAIEAVTDAGGEVTKVSNDAELIQGWLPLDALQAVAADDDVYLIRRPSELVLLEEVKAANSTTEGLSVINGQAWHAAGYTGSGVKIGIIDGGFQGYQSLLGADLPASVTVKNFVDGQTDAQVDGTSKHGTACVEIIHDIAPEATLYLAKTATNLDLQEAVAWLKDTHQVDIISSSIGWYNLTPGDGTGEFADLVQDARDAGILWITAAGDDREAHWGGAYYDPGSTGFHHYNAEQSVNFFGPGDGNAYNIPAGFLVGIFLRWNDWAQVDQNYDLYLLRWNGSEWDMIDQGEDLQDGGAGQRPTEFVIAETTGSATPYAFVIKRTNSNRAVNLEVFAPNLVRLDEILHARSLCNLSDAPGAMTVAALDVSAPYPQESYSSEGPTNGPGGAETGGFPKPDIAAFANVSTESYGTADFSGTSAATPHVAGGAALLLSAYPAYTPDQLQSFLEGLAVDMGPAGMDTVYGHGRLHLGDPPRQQSLAFLPVVQKMFFACDPYEPNDTRGAAWGPLVAGQAYQARLCRGDYEDNYYLNALSSQPLVVTIDLPPTLVGYTHAWIWDENAAQPVPGCGRGPITSAHETINCPITEAGRYTIKLYTDDSAIHYDNDQYYTLRATFAPQQIGTPTPSRTPGPTPTLTSIRTPTRTPSATPNPTPTSTDVPGSRTFIAIEDAAILEGYPDVNAGTAGDMWAGFDDGLDPQGRIVRSLIKFDLSSVPASATVQSATLRVYYVGFRDYSDRVRTVTAYRITGDWTESSVTWNNAPGPGASYGSVDIVATDDWGWHDLDVRDLVQGWVNRSIPSQGVMLRGPEASGADSSYRSFSTREGPHPPELVINYVGATAASQAPAAPAEALNGPLLRDYLGGSAAPADASGRIQREWRP